MYKVSRVVFSTRHLNMAALAEAQRNTEFKKISERRPSLKA